MGLVSFFIEIASLTLRGINLSSLHRTLMLSVSGLWPVFWWCSAMARIYDSLLETPRSRTSPTSDFRRGSVSRNSASTRWGRWWVSPKYTDQKCECCWIVLTYFWCLLPTRIRTFIRKTRLFLPDIPEISKVVSRKSVMQYARARHPRTWHNYVWSACTCYKCEGGFHTAYAWQRFLVNDFADFPDVRVKII